MDYVDYTMGYPMDYTMYTARSIAFSRSQSHSVAFIRIQSRSFAFGCFLFAFVLRTQALTSRRKADGNRTSDGAWRAVRVAIAAL